MPITSIEMCPAAYKQPHEYRQRWIQYFYKQPVALPEGYFCKFCLQTKAEG